MRRDILEALQKGRRINKQSFDTARGHYTLTIIEHNGEYFQEKRKDGIVVEAKSIQRDMDPVRRNTVAEMETMCRGLCDGCEWKGGT